MSATKQLLSLRFGFSLALGLAAIGGATACGTDGSALHDGSDAPRLTPRPALSAGPNTCEPGTTVGDTWMPDDCNTCRCTDAGSVCTRIACDPDLDVLAEPLACEGRDLGEVWPEACNECTCTVSGILCTKRGCG